MTFHIFFVLMVIMACATSQIVGANIKKSEIETVNDEIRYFALNPDANYEFFNRVIHAKGNIIFTSGERIDGDHLIDTVIDQRQFARQTDVEVSFWYPTDTGEEGQIISCVELVTDLTTTDAQTFFVNDGGIGRTSAEILVSANRTDNFGYQIYLYGY